MCRKCNYEVKHGSYINVVLMLVVSLAMTACNPVEESKYSHCVVAEDESNFIGEKLKYDGNAKSSVMLTTDCINRDQIMDEGDGQEHGKVRWVVCLQGPDCDEAGMF